MLFILEQGGVYMLIDFTMEKYPELNHKICYGKFSNKENCSKRRL